MENTPVVKRKVLFVDDDPQIRSIQAEVLRSRDIDVTEIEDGLKALNWLQ